MTGQKNGRVDVREFARTFPWDKHRLSDSSRTPRNFPLGQTSLINQPPDPFLRENIKFLKQGHGSQHAVTCHFNIVYFNNKTRYSQTVTSKYSGPRRFLSATIVRGPPKNIKIKIKTRFPARDISWGYRIFSNSPNRFLLVCRSVCCPKSTIHCNFSTKNITNAAYISDCTCFLSYVDKISGDRTIRRACRKSPE